MRSRHVSRVIAAPAAAVYAFAADPGNLPGWAAGLASSDFVREGDSLLFDSPMGRITVRFVPPNGYGILDHDVVLPSGATVTNPVRVLDHPAGSEIVFTLRQMDLTDEEFERDARTVESDLERLRQVVEGQD